MSITVVLAAAGRGERMGSDLPKQFMSVAGRPLLYYSLHTFEQCVHIDHVVAVVPPGFEELTAQEIIAPFRFFKVKKVVPGGSHRQESVLRGLEAAPDDTEYVAVHDGARPFVTKRLIKTLLDVAEKKQAAIPCIGLKDTIKQAEDSIVRKTIDRSTLVAVQTPQVFKAEVLKSAYQKAFSEKKFYTDDAALVERIGVPVHIVEGEHYNVKVTTSEDLEFAEFFIKSGKWDTK